MTRTEIRNHVTLFINNKEIQINGKTDFHQDWLDQGVYSICDILNSSEKFSSLQISVGNFR